MRARLLLALVLIGLLSGCAAPAARPDSGRLRVVTTSVILADLVRNVAGQRASVTSMVPAGADPHTFEPSLRSIREVAYADAAFSNYLMLESHAVIKALDATLPRGVPNVSIAEASTRHGAQVISLVENASLDALWLGLRVRGTGERFGLTRTSEITLRLTEVTGPGTVRGYVTGTFGQPTVFFDSSRGSQGRPIALPPAAHTHMSWAFSQPGRYELGFAAAVKTDDGERPLAAERFSVLVGGSPDDVAAVAGRKLLDKGHADITADLDRGELYIWADEAGGGEHTQRVYPVSSTTIHVPPKALTEIPADPSFRFLGQPGTQVYQLPQAVLGAHVHGEIDPHLWLSVPNVKAYVSVIEETLRQVDPAGASEYARNADAYRQELDKVDADVRKAISTIPEARRQLVTTHDAYGYFSQTYGVAVAGFVASNPGVEPSVAQRRRLVTNLQQLKVPAVFLEPTVLRASSVLAQLADEVGVAICPIYSDTLDDTVPSYAALMRFNATSLATCLR